MSTTPARAAAGWPTVDAEAAVVLPFPNRAAAGRALGRRLLPLVSGAGVLVLALPRGGVPVGYEVAEILQARLDVLLVRKLGVPGHEELAMGAIASGGARVLNEDVIAELGIPHHELTSVICREEQELAHRERLFRPGGPALSIAGQTVIIVDDGLATGASMLVAVRALRHLQPERLIVAVPVAAAETCAIFESEADAVICAATPHPFRAVSLWYENFSQTSDDEVRELLGRSRQRAG